MVVEKRLKPVTREVYFCYCYNKNRLNVKGNSSPVASYQVCLPRPTRISLQKVWLAIISIVYYGIKIITILIPAAKVCGK